MKKLKKIVFSRFFLVAILIIIQIAGLILLNYYLSKIYTWVRFTFNVLALLSFLIIISSDVPSSTMLPWIAIIGISPILGFTCFILFGRNGTKKILSKKFLKKQKEVYKDNSHVSTDLNDFKLVESLTESKVHRNNRTTYLPTGEIFFDTLKAKLRDAKDYILMDYFIIERGVMLDEILEILKDRIDKGVRVYFIVDGFGCGPKMSHKDFKYMRSLGIHLVIFNKFVAIIDNLQNNRDHRKFTVIDGKYGFIGGSNLADEYINVVRPYKWWRDNNLMIEGESIISMVEMFINQYNTVTMDKDDLKIENFPVLEPSFQNNNYTIIYGTGPYPLFERRAAEMIYLDAISQAKEFLYVTTPYLVVDTYVIDQFISAAKRGVDVRIMMPGVPDKYIVNIVGRDNYKRLIEGGVKIFEYGRGFIHSKSLVTEKYGFVGTINFDYRSFIHNFECSAIVTDKDTINAMVDDYLVLLNTDSHLVDLNKRKLNIFEKLIRNLIKIFSPLF